MPFEGEYATGESLLSLQQSEAFREFKGHIRSRAPGPAIAPTILNVPRNGWMPRRVIAVDGSTISEVLDNGFPMAEATLMKVAVVSIDLSRLAVAREDDIPSPRVFYDMESASTFDCVLPGANVVRPDIDDDTPQRFFRQTAFDAFCGRLDNDHETLIETVRAVVGGPHTPARPPRCPIEEMPTRPRRGRRCLCVRLRATRNAFRDRRLPLRRAIQ
jgi:hypothetical protein